MGASEAVCWAGDETELERIVAGLTTHFEIEKERLARSTTYYDTFDWRLWRRGERLEVEPAESGLSARWVGEGQTPRRTRLSREPGLARELGSGDFAEDLGKVISMRRLLARAEVRTEGYLLRVLDRRRKTVVLLTAEQRKTRRPGSRTRFYDLPAQLKLVPVKGYRKDAARVATWLEKHAGSGRGDAVELEEAAAALGVAVGGYGVKQVVQLDPQMAADSAVALALQALMATALANEEGTIKDVDSEFLHDFRVSVRRTRSTLSQLKSVYAPERLSKLRSELSWLGKTTGPTRDLDVYLLKLPSYAAQLPEAVRQDLAPLAELLQELHREEQSALAAALSSRRYKALKRLWAGFVEETPEESARTTRGREPVVDVAVNSIGKAHRKVLRKGAAITDESPARALHRLRLDCKKLRYLIEIFRSLFHRQEVDRFVRALKEFQDNLGDFQDYGVQQEMLRRLAGDLERTHTGGPETLMAIGRLVGRLEAGEVRERQRFAESFAHFSSKRTTKRFRAMLEGGRR
jgi:CHAD domain-containing protein